MRTNRGPFLLALLLVSFVWVGCSEDPRTTAKVETLNGNAPLYSDIYSLGDDLEDPLDDFIPTDLIEATISLYPADYDVDLVPGGPFGGVKFTHYSVKYVLDSDDKEDNADGQTLDGGVDLDGNGTVDVANFVAPMNVWVPVWGKSVTWIAPLPVGIKTVSPIWDLNMTGGVYRFSAVITFYGTEDNSDREMTTSRKLDIFVSDFADE